MPSTRNKEHSTIQKHPPFLRFYHSHIKSDLKIPNLGFLHVSHPHELFLCQTTTCRQVPSKTLNIVQYLSTQSRQESHHDISNNVKVQLLCLVCPNVMKKSVVHIWVPIPVHIFSAVTILRQYSRCIKCKQTQIFSLKYFKMWPAKITNFWITFPYWRNVWF